MTAQHCVAAFGYAPRSSLGRRLFAGSVGPVLVVCFCIIAIWYVGAIFLNAPFQREPRHAPAAETHAWRLRRGDAEPGAPGAAGAAPGRRRALQDHRPGDAEPRSAASSITPG